MATSPTARTRIAARATTGACAPVAWCTGTPAASPLTSFRRRDGAGSSGRRVTRGLWGQFDGEVAGPPGARSGSVRANTRPTVGAMPGWRGAPEFLEPRRVTAASSLEGAHLAARAVV